MAASGEYTDYVLEQLAPVGRVHIMRLFGGVGLTRDAVMFALIMNNTLYFVVDDTTREKYEAAGMAPFAYDTKLRRVQMRRFFTLPEEVLEDRDELRQWAEEAIRVAAAKKAPKPTKRKKAAKRKQPLKRAKRRS